MTKHDFTFSQAVQGFLLAANARHLSEKTIEDYTRSFRKFEVFLDDDRPMNAISSRTIETFLAGQTGLSNKSLLNQYIALSSLWTWAVSQDIIQTQILRKVTPPKPEQREIVPFTEEEIRSLLSVLSKSKIYTRQGTKPTAHTLSSADRNRAILLLLVDTGIRASELCDLKIHQLDSRNQRVHVFGKEAKERTLPFSSRTGQALWRYLATRKDVSNGDPLFLSKLGRRMDRMKLAHLMAAIGERASIPEVHPHHFRHTFAIQYLRNDGDPYTLQYLLGHSTMETVKIYLRLAQIDIQNAHKKASPVDNWNL